MYVLTALITVIYIFKVFIFSFQLIDMFQFVILTLRFNIVCCHKTYFVLPGFCLCALYVYFLYTCFRYWRATYKCRCRLQNYVEKYCSQFRIFYYFLQYLLSLIPFTFNLLKQLHNYAMSVLLFLFLSRIIVST